jgi:transcriptional regulator with XRE-family HTH domain
MSMSFGELLRQWRSTRQLSQLGLATEAGISTRHLSFLETGRSQPSREMVQLLTGILDVPSGDKNMLLVSAGFAPVDGGLDQRATDMLRAEQALRLILKKHEPYPALVLDAGWNIVMDNEGARQMFGMLKRAPAPSSAKKMNVVHTMFNPHGFRQFMVNWEPIAECHIAGLNREIAATGSQEIVKLRDEALSYPGVPARWRTPPAPLTSVPMTLRLKSGDLELSFQSTMTTLGSPGGTAPPLRIEQFFPADQRTDEVARSLAVGDPIVL